MGHVRSELRVLRDGGDHGHEMRLAGAVGGDREESLLVNRSLELQVRHDYVRQLVRHTVGYHECANVLSRAVRSGSLAKHLHRLEGLERD